MRTIDMIARVVLVMLLWPVLLLGPAITAVLLALAMLLGGCGPGPTGKKAPVVMYVTDLETDEQVDRIVGVMKLVPEVQLIIDSKGGYYYLGERFGAAATEFIARGGKLRCTVDGIAMSAAFTVWTYCGERLATKRSTLLWHEPAYEDGQWRRTIHYFDRVGKAQLAFNWTDEQYNYQVELLRQQTVDLFEHYRSVLPMEEQSIRLAYENNRRWSAQELHSSAPGFFTLVN